MINILYLILFAGMLIAGLMTGQIWCIAVCIVMAAAVAVSALLTKLAARNAEFIITVPGVVSKNQRFKVEINLRSNNFLPLGMVSCTLLCRNRLTGETHSYKINNSDARFTLSSKYCGCLDISLENIRFHEWFNIISFTDGRKVKGRVLVMPDMFELDPVAPPATPTLKDTEEYSQDKKGQDRTETFQIRDYVPGDALSQIHWKLSSKAGHPVVRDASLPVDHSLAIFWDRRAYGEDPPAADAIMEAITSTATAYTEAGYAYTLLWNEDTIHTFEVSNPEQLPEAISSLLKAAPPEKNMSGAEIYLKSRSEPQSGRVLYFTRLIPETVSAIREMTDILIFLCEGTNPVDTSMADVVFTPANMKEVFQGLLI